MAFTYGFYNSLNGDRKYNAFQMTQMFDGIILDGVFEAIGQHFAVTAAGGMTVNVGTGRAWFNHTWNDNDNVMPITLPLSDLNRSRYDAVVLEVGDPNTDRTNSIKIVSGTAAVNPTKPVLNRGATNNDAQNPNSETLPPYQHALAYVLVKPGAEEITAGDIEIVVGKDETPFVTGPIETRSIEELFNQWDYQFNQWFNNLKAQLTENVVTNLQAQIDSNREAIEENYEKTLSASTKTLLSLTNTATPDDAFKKLKELVATAQSSANTAQSTAEGRLRMSYGSYKGNGGEGTDAKIQYIDIGVAAKLVIIVKVEIDNTPDSGSYNRNLAVAMAWVGNAWRNNDDWYADIWTTSKQIAVKQKEFMGINWHRSTYYYVAFY